MVLLYPENDFGNIEYKRKIININTDRFEELKTQMLFRLNEGNGICYYYLGINDDGTLYNMNNKEKNETFKNFKNIVTSLSLKINKIENIDKLNYFKITVILKKKNLIGREIRILLLGPSNSGKTTFISSMVNKISDDGNGYCRSKLLKSNHELISGSNSFNLTKSFYYNFNKSNIKITFIDTPGKKKYYKNRNYALTSNNPDIIIFFFNNLNDITNYISYIDYCLLNNKFIFFATIKKIIKEDNIIIKNKLYYIDKINCLNFNKNNFLEKILAKYYKYLPKEQNYNNDYPLFQINSIDFNENNKNLIISGIQLRNKISLNKNYLLGPIFFMKSNKYGYNNPKYINIKINEIFLDENNKIQSSIHFNNFDSKYNNINKNNYAQFNISLINNYNIIDKQFINPIFRNGISISNKKCKINNYKLIIFNQDKFFYKGSKNNKSRVFLFVENIIIPLILSKDKNEYILQNLLLIKNYYYVILQNNSFISMYQIEKI